VLLSPIFQFIFRVTRWACEKTAPKFSPMIFFKTNITFTVENKSCTKLWTTSQIFDKLPKICKHSHDRRNFAQSGHPVYILPTYKPTYSAVLKFGATYIKLWSVTRTTVFHTVRPCVKNCSLSAWQFCISWNCMLCQGCQTLYFHTKIPIWVYFGGLWNG
jgi:hypothetical protein